MNRFSIHFSYPWLLLLLILVLATTLEFRQQYPQAGLLQIPYLLWLCFAAVLNFSVFLRSN